MKVFMLPQTGDSSDHYSTQTSQITRNEWSTTMHANTVVVHTDVDVTRARPLARRAEDVAHKIILLRCA